MKRYKLIKYMENSDYFKVLKFFSKKNCLIIELDFKKIQSLNQLKSILKLRIDAPHHYFNNFIAVYELFEDFPLFKNSQNMIILIKNYMDLRKLNKNLYDDLLKVLNTSSDYLCKASEG